MSQSTTQRRRALGAARCGELQDLAALAQAAADGGAQIGERAGGVGAAPAGAAQVERQTEAADLGLGVG